MSRIVSLHSSFSPGSHVCSRLDQQGTCVNVSTPCGPVHRCTPSKKGIMGVHDCPLFKPSVQIVLSFDLIPSDCGPVIELNLWNPVKPAGFRFQDQ
jgi:hypothetical protein